MQLLLAVRSESLFLLRLLETVRVFRIVLTFKIAYFLEACNFYCSWFGDIVLLPRFSTAIPCFHDLAHAWFSIFKICNFYSSWLGKSFLLLLGFMKAVPHFPRRSGCGHYFHMLLQGVAAAVATPACGLLHISAGRATGHHRLLALLILCCGIRRMWKMFVHEVHFLQLALGLLARAGPTFMALAAVYGSLFGHTFGGTMYATRTHFIQKPEVAVLIFGRLQLLGDSGVDMPPFTRQWYLRPHHVADDFTPCCRVFGKPFAGSPLRALAGYSGESPAVID